MNIKLVRLVTGEDVLTEFEAGDGTVKFTNPLIVYVQPPEHPGQTARVGISQWVPYADATEFTIDAAKVVFVTEPAPDLKKQYDQVFGLGLILPGDPKIATA